MPAMHTARVWIGHDTRPSCRELVKAACDGVESCGARAEVKGLLSTPQLHWMVRQTNQHMPSTETDYYNALSQAFQMLSGSPSNLDQVYKNCTPYTFGKGMVLPMKLSLTILIECSIWR